MKIVSLSALGALALTVSCSTSPARVDVGAEPRVLWEDAPPPQPAAPAAPMGEDEAREIALAHDAAHACELTARALRKRDKQRGWAVMRQCALRPDFTDLETLLAPPWIDDVVRADPSGELIAHAIAARGGDVANDLRIVRKKKVPLFSLAAALEEPEAYRGRLVLLRATPRGGRFADGARALRLVETKVMAESEWVAVGPRSRSQHESETRDPSDGAARASYAERGRRSDGQVVEVLHNVSVETGREVLATLHAEAPFLESHTDYVLVVRFEGTREVVNGSALDEQAVATVVGYFEPESAMFARIAR